MKPSVDQIERGGFQVWSPDEVGEVAGWRLASNGGFTRRLNCATTTGDADTSPGTGEAIRQWLGDRGSPMTVRITPLVEADVQQAAADSWRLVRCDPTPVLLAPVSPVSGSNTHERAAISLPAPDTQAFVDDLFALNDRPPWAKLQWARIVERLGVPAVGLWLPGIATGFVAVVGAIAFVYSVAVHPEHRRTRHGTRIMAAAHAWAAGEGAEWVTLQVQESNEAGRALYADLGYEERYRYHYLQDRPRGGPRI